MHAHARTHTRTHTHARTHTHTRTRQVDLQSDFVQIHQNAKMHIDKFGRDHGNGWLLNHPITKLIMYQNFCLNNPKWKTSGVEEDEGMELEDSEDEEEEEEEEVQEEEEAQPSTPSTPSSRKRKVAQLPTCPLQMHTHTRERARARTHARPLTKRHVCFI